MQGQINGGFDGPWNKAGSAFAMVNRIFPPDSFAAIARYVSVVPANTTAQRLPQNFRSLDATCRFEPFQFPQARQIIDEIQHLRDKGYPVYNSDEYLCLFPSLLPVGDVAGAL